MIELVMVIVILGVMSVFLAPRLLGLNTFTDAGFHDNVVAALQYARKAAVAQRRNVTVALSASTLTLTVDTLNDDPNKAGTFVALALPVAVSGCLANQVCSPKSGILALTGPASLTFNPLGQATASTYVYTLTDSSTAYSAAITVDAITGYVY